MDQEKPKLDAPTPLTDNVDRDWLLQHLVANANQSHDFRFPITLWFGGGVISGVLVSGSVFFDAYTADVLKVAPEEAKEETREMLREMGDVYYQPPEVPDVASTGFIHMVDAKFWNPSGQVPTRSSPGVAWRGRISQVIGFNLGQMQVQD